MNEELFLKQAEEIMNAEPWYVAAMSNLSALIMDSMPQLNWAGFYLMRGGRLVVGPFQGKPACVHIAVGRGVCGTCVAQDRAIRVPDVHAFPGHIACDSASRSELVIPLHSAGAVVAVLDLDSPVEDRFSEEDQHTLEALSRLIEARIAWAE